MRIGTDGPKAQAPLDVLDYEGITALAKQLGRPATSERR